MPTGSGVSVAGDQKVNPYNPTILALILRNIRTMESGGNYTALNKTASASGAYQIIDSSWRSWAAASGVPGATSYPRAYQAPPEVQDAVAAWKVQGILTSHDNWLSSVPIIWYYPVAWNNTGILNSIPAPEAGNKLTVKQYAERWLTAYNKIGDTTPQTVPSDSGGVPSILKPFGWIPGAGATGDVLGGAIDAAGTMLDLVKTLAHLLTDPHTWMRVAQVIGGAVLIGAGLWIVSHEQPVQAAGGLVEQGAVAAAVA